MENENNGSTEFGTSKWFESVHVNKFIKKLKFIQEFNIKLGEYPD